MNVKIKQTEQEVANRNRDIKDLKHKIADKDRYIKVKEVEWKDSTKQFDISNEIYEKQKEIEERVRAEAKVQCDQIREDYDTRILEAKDDVEKLNSLAEELRQQLEG